ncbi:MAG: hypothetical protein ACLPWS_02305 [Rhodomicrobium sp.]
MVNAAAILYTTDFLNRTFWGEFAKNRAFCGGGEMKALFTILPLSKVRTRNFVILEAASGNPRSCNIRSASVKIPSAAHCCTLRTTKAVHRFAARTASGNGDLA